MPDFPAISHVAVTVSDLARSTQWYTALIGSDPVLDEDEAKGAYHHTGWALPGGQLFGIHTHQAAGGAPLTRAAPASTTSPSPARRARTRTVGRPFAP